jgi:hypothetical protein
MGHPTNEWIQRLSIPICILATIMMLHLGFGLWRILAILLPIFGLLMLAMIAAGPGPKTKNFVEGLKRHFR